MGSEVSQVGSVDVGLRSEQEVSEFMGHQATQMINRGGKEVVFNRVEVRFHPCPPISTSFTMKVFHFDDYKLKRENVDDRDQITTINNWEVDLTRDVRTYYEETLHKMYFKEGDKLEDCKIKVLSIWDEDLTSVLKSVPVIKHIPTNITSSVTREVTEVGSLLFPKKKKKDGSKIRNVYSHTYVQVELSLGVKGDRSFFVEIDRNTDCASIRTHPTLKECKKVRKKPRRMKKCKVYEAGLGLRYILFDVNKGIGGGQMYNLLENNCKTFAYQVYKTVSEKAELKIREKNVDMFINIKEKVPKRSTSLSKKQRKKFKKEQRKRLKARKSVAMVLQDKMRERSQSTGDLGELKKRKGSKKKKKKSKKGFGLFKSVENRPLSEEMSYINNIPDDEEEEEDF